MLRRFGGACCVHPKDECNRYSWMLKWFGGPSHFATAHPFIIVSRPNRGLRPSIDNICLGFSGASPVTWRWVCPLMEDTPFIWCSTFQVLRCRCLTNVQSFSSSLFPRPFTLAQQIIPIFLSSILGNLIASWLLISGRLCIICKSYEVKSVFTCIMFCIYPTIFNNENSGSGIF